MTQVGDYQQETKWGPANVVPRHNTQCPERNVDRRNCQLSTPTHGLRRETHSLKRGTPAHSHAFAIHSATPPHNPRPSTPVPHRHPIDLIASISCVAPSFGYQDSFVSSNRRWWLKRASERGSSEREAGVVVDRQSRADENGKVRAVKEG
ncbi:uncharacterized protein STEHIDRAFT_120034 [Stereum hirsutum FP-91666 SS1]|uniref:uncharacterized protein n=1 Tax=Stereum hirsutum (strain FP-91666) TaxID=721885 RepID=UPI000440D42A|nr:uncharacterized protein STEHIDRAFT_120034 [Stereum hirsutum FP-91666 SS1]EIM89402.1 hypothetical protein STEHIDRAFT_120034 [Stereum hirsutum FP-91666 SS1]